MSNQKQRIVLAMCFIPLAAYAQHYQATNLVANTSALASKVDGNLVNGWGISRSSTSFWWVSDNGTGKSTLYNGAGDAQQLVVNVPGAPTGTVFHGGPGFEVAPGQPAKFLFASEDGSISGWNSGTQAIAKVPASAAVFKGLALATLNGKPYLYAADFHNGRIDMFNDAFQPVPGMGEMEDSELFNVSHEARLGLSPFNIVNIGDNLVVTFAKPDADRHDDVAGPGNGAIAVFNSAGRRLRTFEHVSALNGPWGVALAPGDFGAFSHHLLVGQFGSGQVAAYNLATGRFVGVMLAASGQPLTIDGLWGIGFGNGGNAGPATTLFFAAGPADESEGVFGTVTPAAAELTQGNSN